MSAARPWLMLVATAAGVVGLAGSGESQAPPISKAYIFSQAICLPPATSTPGVCVAQTVPRQSTVQIQLPGTPSRWKVVAQDGVKLKRMKVIPDPLRIAGTSEIYIFDFGPTRRGTGRITMQESPPFLAKQSKGRFTYTVTIE